MLAVHIYVCPSVRTYKYLWLHTYIEFHVARIVLMQQQQLFRLKKHGKVHADFFIKRQKQNEDQLTDINIYIPMRTRKASK